VKEILPAPCASCVWIRIGNPDCWVALCYRLEPPVARPFVYSSRGSLIAEYGGPATNGGTSYLASDHLGSTRVVTGGTVGDMGKVLARYDYQPFGTFILGTIGNRTKSFPEYGLSDDTRQKFTSKERDFESNLDFFGARYYASPQARFASADSVSGDPVDPQSFNKYSYVMNAPLSFTDPTGHFPLPQQGFGLAPDSFRDLHDLIAGFEEDREAEAGAENLAATITDVVASSDGNVISWSVEFVGDLARITIVTGGAAAAGETAVEAAPVVVTVTVTAAAAYVLIESLPTPPPGDRDNSSRARRFPPPPIGNASRNARAGVHLTEQQETLKRVRGVTLSALAHVGYIQNGKGPDCPPGSQCYKDNLPGWRSEIEKKTEILEKYLKRLKGKAIENVQKDIDLLRTWTKPPE
jgi:RHS repeat-associated protein